MCMYACIYTSIEYILELSWLENLVKTYMPRTEYRTAVSTLLGLISSAHRNLHQ